MLTSAISSCLLRDLTTFATELDAFPDEAGIWALPPGVSNSTGTLTLHCCGNLRTFIGARLGGTGYLRDRDAEFATRGVPREELKALIATTCDEVQRTLAALSDEAVAAMPAMELGRTLLPMPLALVHLATHLAYHLGQADIHRRLATGENRTVGAMGVNGLVIPPAA